MSSSPNSPIDQFRHIDFNQEFSLAFELIEHTKTNLFVTGRAGTGKSTLLEYFRHRTQKKIAVLAPTGVAAINIKGQTIHSFFMFRPDITPDSVDEIYVIKKKRDLYAKLETLVIDEISMVRADLLDCIDMFL
ncbi:MAG: AAA family ATPase, partial [Candidatus Omnitrophica bacterium]|nr:AAA family ATPase [Candidatus Omnitrophota bacterium]